MDTLNSLLTRCGDLLFKPFTGHAALGLTFWSIVAGVIMAVVVGKTSNQRKLRRAADQSRAQLYAIKLFKDDLLVTFQCQVALLRATAARLWHSIPPMLVMIIPMLLVLVQLAMRFEFRPLVPGEQVVVAMRIKPNQWKKTRKVELAPDKGFAVDTASLRDEQLSTLYWRVRADDTEPRVLRWDVNGSQVTKVLPMAASHSQLVVANPKRPGPSLMDRIFYPAESALEASSPVESIELQLVPRSTPILGWNIPWWGTFFLLSMIVAFLAGKWLGVQF
ncbi:MAG: hypothetical protein U0795_18840 [Pirellulales bacterium]